MSRSSESASRSPTAAGMTQANPSGGKDAGTAAESSSAVNGSLRSERSSEPLEESPPDAFQLKALLAGPFDLRTLSLTGLFLIAFFFTLSVARGLFLPIVVAVLLTFLFDPPVRYLDRRGVPRGLASALVLLVFIGLLGFGFERTLEPARGWMEQVPGNLRQLERKVKRILEPVEEVSQAARQVERLAQMQDDDNEAPLEVSSNPSLGKSIFDGTQSLLFGTGVVLVMTFFLLSSGDLFLHKVVRMLPRLHDRKKVVGIARQVQRDVSTHLLTITSINLSLGACVALATQMIGLPNAVLWGVMAALLNFVPYLGAIAGTLFLTGASLLTFDDLSHMLAAPAVYLVLTAVEGSLMTPLVLGRRLSLNPVVIFLGLFFWGWIWGVAGALLAVPLLISFKITCDHLEPLEPIGELLGP